MAVTALFQLLPNQLDESDIEDDIPANEDEDSHFVMDFNLETEAESMKTQSLLLAKKEDTTYIKLAEYTNAFDNDNFFDELGKFKTCTTERRDTEDFSAVFEGKGAKREAQLDNIRLP